METTTYLDWLGAAEKALQELTARKRKVFVTGLSMGGVLTMNLVRLLWLNNSYHVSTLDNDKDVILQWAGDFFTELARS